MRIVQINVLAMDRSTGRTTYELHNYLKKNGHESYVAYGLGKRIDDPSFYKISNKIDYYFHNVFARIFGTQGFHSLFPTMLLIKWLSKIKPDIVHLRNLHSNYININLLSNYLAKENIATLITTHDFWFLTGACSFPNEKCNIKECDKCLKRRHFFNISYYKKKREIFSRIGNFWIQANSFFSKSIVEKSFLKDRPCEVIYNWIDFGKFFPDYKKDAFGDDIEKPVVLAVWSSLNEESDRFRFFAKISKILSNKYSFIMIGNHSFKESIYPSIKFLQGTNDIDVLRGYYSSANVLFDPSTTDSFGKVVAESICCGTPCVVFNNQALPELIGNNKCGVIVEPFNVEESINAIDYVIEKGTLFYRDACIEQSKKLFDYEKNCKKLVKCFEKMINYGK